MNSEAAIVIAALIIGAAIFGSRMEPKFQVSPGVGADGNPFAWRIDMQTGTIEGCGFVKDAKLKIYSVQCESDIRKERKNSLLATFDPDATELGYVPTQPKVQP